jgi:hypothetical protein
MYLSPTLVKTLVKHRPRGAIVIKQNEIFWESKRIKYSEKLTGEYEDRTYTLSELIGLYAEMLVKTFAELCGRYSTNVQVKFVRDTILTSSDTEFIGELQTVMEEPNRFYNVYTSFNSPYLSRFTDEILYFPKTTDYLNLRTNCHLILTSFWG